MQERIGHDKPLAAAGFGLRRLIVAASVPRG
jgi:hypothetical protein